MCETDYHFSSSENTCKKCKGVEAGFVVMVLVLVFVGACVAGGFAFVGLKKKKMVNTKRFDMARFKVVWAAFQISGVVDWALELTWPEPFASIQAFISLLTSFSLSKVRCDASVCSFFW